MNNEFMQMLVDYDIHGKSTWEDAFPSFITDKRYGSLPTLADRKACFEQYIACFAPPILSSNTLNIIEEQSIHSSPVHNHNNKHRVSRLRDEKEAIKLFHSILACYTNNNAFNSKDDEIYNNMSFEQLESVMREDHRFDEVVDFYMNSLSSWDIKDVKEKILLLMYEYVSNLSRIRKEKALKKEENTLFEYRLWLKNNTFISIDTKFKTIHEDIIILFPSLSDEQLQSEFKQWIMKLKDKQMSCILWEKEKERIVKREQRRIARTLIITLIDHVLDSSDNNNNIIIFHPKLKFRKFYPYIEKSSNWSSIQTEIGKYYKRSLLKELYVDICSIYEDILITFNIRTILDSLCNCHQLDIHNNMIIDNIMKVVIQDGDYDHICRQYIHMYIAERRGGARLTNEEEFIVWLDNILPLEQLLVLEQAVGSSTSALWSALLQYSVLIQELKDISEINEKFIQLNNTQMNELFQKHIKRLKRKRKRQ